MSHGPQLRFLSLFVPDLDAARAQYELLLGVPPLPEDQAKEAAFGCPIPHPFSDRPPVVFELGPVHLGIYQAVPKQGTHPGDTGIGLIASEPIEALAERAAKAKARVFYGPKPMQGDGRAMAVVVTPDRHFFEVTEERK